jgi:hypothetical protein
MIRKFDKLFNSFNSDSENNLLSNPINPPPNPGSESAQLNKSTICALPAAGLSAASPRLAYAQRPTRAPGFTLLSLTQIRVPLNPAFYFVISSACGQYFHRTTFYNCVNCGIVPRILWCGENTDQRLNAYLTTL